MTTVKTKFQYALDFTFSEEGGYANLLHDNGKQTNMGITIATLSNWRKNTVTENDVKNLKREEAIEIYKEFYWKPCRCDEMPTPIACMVFDFAVNSGGIRAILEMQKILGVDDDGVAGKRTLSAICAINTKALINAYAVARLAFLKSLRNWVYFGEGWQKRVHKMNQYANKINKEIP